MSLVTTVIGVIVTLVILYLVLSYYFMKTANLTSLKEATESQEILVSDISSDINSSNYTYSVWFYVEDWNYRFGYPKILLSKTSDKIPIPSVVLGDVMNNIKIFVGCYSDNSEEFIEHEDQFENDLMSFIQELSAEREEEIQENRRISETH